MKKENNPSKNVSLEFFEGVKDIIPVKENGEIDIEKFRELLLNGDKDNPKLRYIFSKIPEYFARGSDSFGFILKFSQRKDKEFNSDEMLRKMADGDLSDLKEFEEVYPNLEKVAKLLHGGIGMLSYDMEKLMWETKEAVPDSWRKDIEKYPKVYDTIVKNGGGFDYKDQYLFDKDQVDRLMDRDDVDKDMLKFARKMLDCYELAKRGDIYKKFDDKQINQEKEYLKQKEEEIRKLEAELEEINTKLGKFNFITSRIRKTEKAELTSKQTQISDKIKSFGKSMEYCQRWIDEKESEKEFSENYLANYSKRLNKQVVPLIKKAIEERYTHEEKIVLSPMVDKIAELFFTKEYMEDSRRDPLLSLDEQLTDISDVPFENYIEKFNNALITIAGVPNAIVKYEKSENKDLNTLLGIIRSDLGEVPTDDDHGKVDEGYRTHNLREGIDEFMGYSADHTKIGEAMDHLNEEYKELMDIDDPKEYVKKAGILWYRFMLIHPYSDGNGRTGRHLINAMLAQKGFVMQSMFKDKKEQYRFNKRLDKHVLHTLRPSFDNLGDEFYGMMKDKLVDLTGEDRLQDKKEIDIQER